MFLHPYVLGLLLLPVLLAVYQIRRSSGHHRWLAIGLRLLALSLVIVALARPFQRTAGTVKQVVAVVDCSPSMGASDMAQAAAGLKTLVEQAGPGKLRLVVFGSSAREVALDDAVLTAEGLTKLRFSEPGSAIGEALDLAAALCPDDANGDVHLFSDGRETRGGMVSAAAELGRRRLDLKIHELGRLAASRVLLHQVRVPGAAAVGEAVTFTAEVESQSASEAKLTVSNDKGELVASHELQLRAGVQEVSLQVRPDQSGWQRYQVALDRSDQTLATGLKVSRTVVGVVETAPDAPALQALRDLLGSHAEIKTLTLADLESKHMDGIDVITLADTPAAELTIGVQKNLRTWVENGGGLLVTGGRNAFGPGGYDRSELAAMLPLRFPQKKEVRDPGTSLAIIIDTSGSMGSEGVSLAQEVARLALKRLKPHDKAGIVEFHGAKRWAAPMQAASNNIAIQRSLNRLASGGGTVMLPAIEEAYYGLLNVRTRTKHVLVLTDGGVEQGAFEPLLRRMAVDGIHLSTVLVGPRSGSTFLSQLAGWGRGQFYTAPSRFKIPEVIVKQPSSSLLDSFVEIEMGMEPVRASQLMQKLELKDAPKLRGYVKTEAKETAELLLRSEVGDPILARWHYGLGRVAVLTTQLGGTWAEDFLNWPAAPNLMANLTRQLGGSSPRGPLSLSLNWHRTGLDLDIRAWSPEPALAAASLRVEVKDASDALVATQDLMPVRAHRWRTRIEDLPAGDCMVEVRDTTSGKVLASGGLVVPSPNEFSRAAPDRASLAAAARAARDFAAKAAAPKAPVLTRELWPICAGLGLVSFLLMILVRRLPGASTAAPGMSRRVATALALLFVATLAMPPANAAAKPADLDRLIQMHINKIIGMKPVEARQEMKKKCRQLLWQGGDLTTLCAFLRSSKDPKVEPLLAVALFANGNLDEAEALFAKLAKDPEADNWASAELALVRQRIQENLNRKDLALAPTLAAEEEARINEIVGMKPDEARQALTGLCQEMGRRHGDLALLCTHLRSMTEAPAAKPLLALAAVANGGIHEADNILSTITAAPDADLWAVSELARIKEILGDGKSALALFERALKLTTDPGARFALRVRLAQLRYEAKDLAAARTVLRSIAADPTTDGQEGRNYCARLAALHGDDSLVEEIFKPTGTGNTLRRNLLFLGESLARLGKPAEACKHFETALGLCTLERDSRYVLDRMVGAARAMNALPALIDSWLKSEEMLPEQLDMMIGILGGELDRTADVLSLLDRSDLPAKTRKLIETPPFQERLAMLAAETGKSELARRAYQKLIERNPDEFIYRHGYVRLLLMEGDRTAAEDVYREVGNRAKEASELMEAAASARAMGLKELAIQAAQKAGGMGESAHLQTQLFMADVFHEQGDSDQTLEILVELERGVKGNVDRITQVGDAYERYGFVDAAIRMFQAADPNSNERVMAKLIALMEGQNRDEEAYVLWRRLWDTATEPMAIIQANDRLLDIGSKTGKLADLAIELEEHLDQGKLREREQSLLLDIYTSVGDPVSAADVLMEHPGQQGGEDRTAKYKQLLRVYMECELFGRCNAVLNKLIALDPANREEYLQTLILIALERKNDGDALVVLDQVAQRSKDGILRDSFSGSVLKMIGRYDDAARVYRRALAGNSDDVETWLMWGNAMMAVDEKERSDARKLEKIPPRPNDQAGSRQVCGLFSVMLETSRADDLFTIAIDGLLNAGAPPQTLENALRRLNERIAADPHNFLLYRLSADLNEELGRLRRVDQILRQGLIVADDESSVIVRELIGMAGIEKRNSDAVAYSRSLLNIATHLPPDECLNIGTMLLEKGHTNEADVAFQRVISNSRAMGAARGVVEQYENVGRFDKAAKILRGLLIGNAFDVELLLRLGLVEEKNGDFDAAGKAYAQAIQLMMGRLPRIASKAVSKAGERKINVDEITQFLAPAVRGLIVSTRTPASRRLLLDDMGQRVRDESEKLKASNALSANTSDNPRLEHLSKIMRQIGIAFHEPRDGDIKDNENSRVIKSFLGGREAVEKMLASNDLDAAEQATVLTLLALHGYDDLVDKVKAICDLNQTPENDGELLLTAGLAANHPRLVRDVLFANLNRLRKALEALGKGTKARIMSTGRSLALYNQIIAAWPVLSEEDRSSVVNLYGMLIEETEYIDPLRCSHHFLLCQVGRANEVPFDAIEHYAQNSSWSFISHHISAIMDGWIGQRPAAERPEAVRRLLGTRQGNERATLLARLSEYLSTETLTGELKMEFPELAPSRERVEATPATSDEASRMMAQKRAELQKSITAARQKMGSDVGLVLTLHEITLRPAADMLPPAELDILVKDFKTSSDPFDKLIAFLLLIHAGRDADAMVQLEVIAALNADDAATEAVRAAMPIILNTYGWHVQALTFGSGGTAASGSELEMFVNLHDPLAILEDMGGNRLGASKLRIHAAKLMASPAQHLQATRSYFADTRHPDVIKDFSQWYSTRTWPRRVAPAWGGLVGGGKNDSGTILDDIGELPGGQDELCQWLCAIEAGRAHDDEMCAAIAASVSKHGISPQLRQDWQSAVERSLLNSSDMDLIAAIAVQAPGQLPKELDSQIEGLVLNDWRMNSERAAALAAACKALGKPALARSLGRWSVTMELLATGSSGRLPDYLASFPEAERVKLLTGLLPHMGPSKQRVMTGDGLGPMLATLLDQGMTAEAARMIDCYLRYRPFKLHPFLRDSLAYKAMIGGLSADLHVQDDAVAVSLARLNRPEDYERVLYFKAQKTRPKLSPAYRSTSLSAVTPANHTAALPEPGDVDDINRYLDIHLKMALRLRNEGGLSPVNQVAWICMLGEWCAKRGLQDRAASLLEQAEKLSVGMFTGRLWVADLHRLLGNPDAAERIEQELLELDLLPVPRVLGALEVMAATKGRAEADAVAFRVAGYSNHPEVLPQALRHARAKSLSNEHDEIAERLRKVSTQFLPAGK